MEERITCVEDAIENTNIWSKKCKSEKVPNSRHPKNLRHNEQDKHKNNRNKRL